MGMRLDLQSGSNYCQCDVCQATSPHLYPNAVASTLIAAYELGWLFCIVDDYNVVTVCSQPCMDKFEIEHIDKILHDNGS